MTRGFLHASLLRLRSVLTERREPGSHFWPPVPSPTVLRQVHRSIVTADATRFAQRAEAALTESTAAQRALWLEFIDVDSKAGPGIEVALAILTDELVSPGKNLPLIYALLTDN